MDGTAAQDPTMKKTHQDNVITNYTVHLSPSKIFSSQRTPKRKNKAIIIKDESDDSETMFDDSEDDVEPIARNLRPRNPLPKPRSSKQKQRSKQHKDDGDYIVISSGSSDTNTSDDGLSAPMMLRSKRSTQKYPKRRMQKRKETPENSKSGPSSRKPLAASQLKKQPPNATAKTSASSRGNPPNPKLLPQGSKPIFIDLTQEPLPQSIWPVATVVLEPLPLPRSSVLASKQKVGSGKSSSLPLSGHKNVISADPPSTVLSSQNNLVRGGKSPFLPSSDHKNVEEIAASQTKFSSIGDAKTEGTTTNSRNKAQKQKVTPPSGNPPKIVQSLLPSASNPSGANLKSPATSKAQNQSITPPSGDASKSTHSSSGGTSSKGRAGTESVASSKTQKALASTPSGNDSRIVHSPSFSTPNMGRGNVSFLKSANQRQDVTPSSGNTTPILSSVPRNTLSKSKAPVSAPPSGNASATGKTKSMVPISTPFSGDSSPILSSAVRKTLSRSIARTLAHPSGTVSTISSKGGAKETVTVRKKSSNKKRTNPVSPESQIIHDEYRRMIETQRNLMPERYAPKGQGSSDTSPKGQESFNTPLQSESALTPVKRSKFEVYPTEALRVGAEGHCKFDSDETMPANDLPAEETESRLAAASSRETSSKHLMKSERTTTTKDHKKTDLTVSDRLAPCSEQLSARSRGGGGPNKAVTPQKRLKSPVRPASTSKVSPILYGRHHTTLGGAGSLAMTPTKYASSTKSGKTTPVGSSAASGGCSVIGHGVSGSAKTNENMVHRKSLIFPEISLKKQLRSSEVRRGPPSVRNTKKEKPSERREMSSFSKERATSSDISPRKETPSDKKERSRKREFVQTVLSSLDEGMSPSKRSSVSGPSSTKLEHNTGHSTRRPKKHSNSASRSQASTKIGGNTKLSSVTSHKENEGNTKRSGIVGHKENGGNTKLSSIAGHKEKGGSTKLSSVASHKENGGNTKQSGIAGHKENGGDTKPLSITSDKKSKSQLLKAIFGKSSQTSKLHQRTTHESAISSNHTDPSDSSNSNMILQSHISRRTSLSDSLAEKTALKAQAEQRMKVLEKLRRTPARGIPKPSKHSRNIKNKVLSEKAVSTTTKATSSQAVTMATGHITDDYLTRIENVLLETMRKRLDPKKPAMTSQSKSEKRSQSTRPAPNSPTTAPSADPPSFLLNSGKVEGALRHDNGHLGKTAPGNVLVVRNEEEKRTETLPRDVDRLSKTSKHSRIIRNNVPLESPKASKTTESNSGQAVSMATRKEDNLVDIEKFLHKKMKKKLAPKKTVVTSQGETEPDHYLLNSSNSERRSRSPNSLQDSPTTTPRADPSHFLLNSGKVEDASPHESQNLHQIAPGNGRNQHESEGPHKKGEKKAQGGAGPPSKYSQNHHSGSIETAKLLKNSLPIQVQGRSSVKEAKTVQSRHHQPVPSQNDASCNISPKIVKSSDSGANSMGKSSPHFSVAHRKLSINEKSPGSDCGVVSSMSGLLKASLKNFKVLGRATVPIKTVRPIKKDVQNSDCDAKISSNKPGNGAHTQARLSTANCPVPCEISDNVSMPSQSKSNNPIVTSTVASAISENTSPTPRNESNPITTNSPKTPRSHYTDCDVIISGCDSTNISIADIRPCSDETQTPQTPNMGSISISQEETVIPKETGELVPSCGDKGLRLPSNEERTEMAPSSGCVKEPSVPLGEKNSEANDWEERSQIPPLSGKSSEKCPSASCDNGVRLVQKGAVSGTNNMDCDVIIVGNDAKVDDEGISLKVRLPSLSDEYETAPENIPCSADESVYLTVDESKHLSADEDQKGDGAHEMLSKYFDKQRFMDDILIPEIKSEVIITESGPSIVDGSIHDQVAEMTCSVPSVTSQQNPTTHVTSQSVHSSDNGSGSDLFENSESGDDEMLPPSARIQKRLKQAEEASHQAEVLFSSLSPYPALFKSKSPKRPPVTKDRIIPEPEERVLEKASPAEGRGESSVDCIKNTPDEKREWQNASVHNSKKTPDPIVTSQPEKIDASNGLQNSDSTVPTTMKSQTSDISDRTPILSKMFKESDRLGQDSDKSTPIDRVRSLPLEGAQLHKSTPLEGDLAKQSDSPVTQTDFAASSAPPNDSITIISDSSDVDWRLRAVTDSVIPKADNVRKSPDRDSADRVLMESYIALYTGIQNNVVYVEDGDDDVIIPQQQHSVSDSSCDVIIVPDDDECIEQNNVVQTEDGGDEVIIVQQQNNDEISCDVIKDGVNAPSPELLQPERQSPSSKPKLFDFNEFFDDDDSKDGSEEDDDLPEMFRQEELAEFTRKRPVPGDVDELPDLPETPSSKRRRLQLSQESQDSTSKLHQTTIEMLNDSIESIHNSSLDNDNWLQGVSADQNDDMRSRLRNLEPRSMELPKHVAAVLQDNAFGEAYKKHGASLRKLVKDKLRENKIAKMEESLKEDMKRGLHHILDDPEETEEGIEQYDEATKKAMTLIKRDWGMLPRVEVNSDIFREEGIGFCQHTMSLDKYFDKDQIQAFQPNLKDRISSCKLSDRVSHRRCIVEDLLDRPTTRVQTVNWVIDGILCNPVCREFFDLIHSKMKSSKVPLIKFQLFKSLLCRAGIKQEILDLDETEDGKRPFDEICPKCRRLSRRMRWPGPALSVLKIVSHTSIIRESTPAYAEYVTLLLLALHEERLTRGRMEVTTIIMKTLETADDWEKMKFLIAQQLLNAPVELNVLKDIVINLDAMRGRAAELSRIVAFSTLTLHIHGTDISRDEDLDNPETFISLVVDFNPISIEANLDVDEGEDETNTEKQAFYHMSLLLPMLGICLGRECKDSRSSAILDRMLGVLRMMMKRIRDNGFIYRSQVKYELTAFTKALRHVVQKAPKANKSSIFKYLRAPPVQEEVVNASFEETAEVDRESKPHDVAEESKQETEASQ